jgi:hypothetical protein
LAENRWSPLAALCGCPVLLGINRSNDDCKQLTQQLMLFWVMTLCGLVGRHQRFRETSIFRVGIYLRVHTTQNSNIVVVTAVRTPSLTQQLISLQSILLVSFHLRLCHRFFRRRFRNNILAKYPLSKPIKQQMKTKKECYVL